MLKKYYKVITKKRWSAFIKNKRVRVRYPVNEWVKPKIKGSKLLVFNRRDSAMHWMQYSEYTDTLMVVPCLCKGVTNVDGFPIIRVHGWLDDLNPVEVSVFWDAYHKLLKKFTLKKMYAITEHLERSTQNQETHRVCLGRYNSSYASSVKCIE